MWLMFLLFFSIGTSNSFAKSRRGKNGLKTPLTLLTLSLFFIFFNFFPSLADSYNFNLSLMSIKVNSVFLLAHVLSLYVISFSVLVSYIFLLKFIKK